MGRFLFPDYYFESVLHISPTFLIRRGIGGVILDIDNTLVFYDVMEPSPENLAWIGALRAAGIAVAFVSNGSRERVEAYNRRFGFYMSHKSKKPSPAGFWTAAEQMGLVPAQVAVVGDQIFTDIWGGNRADMLTLLVKPLRQEPWLRFKIKRMLERPILARLSYHREEA